MRSGILNTGNIVQNSAGFISLATGNTIQRPSTASNGMLRYNTDYGYIEQYVANTWSNISSGSTPTPPIPPGFIQNILYGSPAIDGNNITSQYYTNGTMYALPFFVSGTFNRIGFNIQNTYSSGSAIVVGIYSNSNGGPGALLYDMGSIPTTSTGAKEVVFSNSSAIMNQWIWVSIFLTTPLNMYAYGFTNNGSNFLGRVNSTDYDSGLCITTSYSGSTNPSTFPTPTITYSNAPYVWIRRV